MSTATETWIAATARSRSSSYAATALMASAVVGGAVGLATSTFYPTLAKLGTAPFLYSGAILSLAHLAAIAGVAGLATSGAAGRGWLVRVAYVLTFLGLTCQLLGESVIRFDFSLGNTFFSAGTPAMGLGFILVGIAIIRAGRWSGWQRFTALACGVYVPVVLIPAFILAGGVSFPALTVWQLCFLALGIAMRAEPARRQG
jgi:hypothetical protein